MDMFGIFKFHLPQVHAALSQKVAYVLWGGLAFVSLTFLMRGLSGAFHQQISPLAACCGTLLAAGFSLAALGSYRLSRARFSSRKEHAGVAAVTVLPTLLLGIVISPASSSIGIAWVTAWAIGLAICVELFAKQSAKRSRSADGTDALDEGLVVSLPVRSGPDVTQWMTRRMVTDQGERWDAVEGQTAVKFAAGQRNVTVHISICPPMPGVPEIECEVPDHPEVEWKVAAQHPYGIRLEVRRPAPSGESLTIDLGYHMASLIRRDLKAG